MSQEIVNEAVASQEELLEEELTSDINEAIDDVEEDIGTDDGYPIPADEDALEACVLEYTRLGEVISAKAAAIKSDRVAHTKLGEAIKLYLTRRGFKKIETSDRRLLVSTRKSKRPISAVLVGDVLGKELGQERALKVLKRIEDSRNTGETSQFLKTVKKRESKD